MSEWKQKRFWTETAAVETDGGWTVTLDGRSIKTPTKSPLILPTAGLAALVAEEWDAQVDDVDPTTMPATRLANAAIDKVAVQREEVIDLLTEYGGSDLICYRADHPDRLVARQTAAWDPLVDWAAHTYGAPLKIGTGVMHIAQDAVSLNALRAPLDSLGNYQLAAIYDLIALSGSLVIGLKASQSDDPAPLWAASRVDETFQAEEWGHDEEAESHAALKESAFLAAHRHFQLCR